MQEVERLISLPADALVSTLLINKDIRSFSLIAYIPKTHGRFDERFEFDAGENIFKILSELKQTHDSRFVIAFFSGVQTDNGPMHFPMLDFSSTVSDCTTDRAKQVVEELGEKRGAILMSGRSYHYYGFDLISNASWEEFLNKASSYPEIGKRSINYHLRDRGCSLRLTSNESKPTIPFVVDTIG